MSLTSGSRIGPYEVVAPLGAGGMGEVYRARDTRLDRTVAIKILPDSLAADPQFRERFDREGRAISQLDHPHICALYDIGDQDGTAYLVMQYLEGETLADRLKKGALPIDQALRHASEIAGALDAAHRAGIVHRDLKPGNVMLTKTGAKLLDFGLAKAAGPGKAGPYVPVVVGAGFSQPGATALPTTPPALTAHGTILGTFQYMAPEQLEGQEADARTDIFAFGAVLYEMLTGKKAFEGKTQASLIAAILDREPHPLSALVPQASAHLEDIIRTCLAKDPDERWQSAGDLRRELTRIAANSSAGAARLAVRGARFGARERVAWAAVVVLAVALAVTLTRLVTGGAAADAGQTLRFEVDLAAQSAGQHAVSPDGRYIAFTAIRDGQRLLWIRSLETLENRALQGTEGVEGPFWSADSQWIGFGADGKLKKVAVSGGFPETLSDLPELSDFRGGTWSRDDVILFAGGIGPVYRISASGGTPSAVTMLDRTRQETTNRWPSFLPDGRHFLFTARSQQPEYHGIYVGSLDSGERVRLVNVLSNAVFAAPGFLLFARDGDLLAQRFDPDQLALEGEPSVVARQVQYAAGTARASFTISPGGLLAYRSVSDNAAASLVTVGRDGRQLEMIGQGDGPALSPDGVRVAVSRIEPDTGTADIWVIDTARRIEAPVTRHPAYDQNAFWSPDGLDLVFSSQREGPAKLFHAPASGNGPDERLSDSATFNRPTDWSADGRFIAYTNADSRTNLDLWALPLFGDRKPFAIARSEFGEAQGRFSPNGRWIAYSSDDSGQVEIYVQAFPVAGERWRLSSTGGSAPKWRRDGRELFYLGADGRLMAVPVTVADTPKFGAPVALFDARLSNTNRDITPYDVGADGQRFVLPAPSEASSRLTVVLNWAAGLPQ